ncbi:hypothetical protein GGX14DRAFT_560226 [Mycena pura]|uniref:Uncharacterized protein n=1 Tax=Mycena pura TaxID=153505 RepID=A0AAD6VT81_9AGAR|nr:hypothetical protein GGX14DRAFT_560226 [Mycena pura]
MSASSFDVVSSRSRSSTASTAPVDVGLEDSDDEIVWSVSEGSLSSSGLSFDPASDDDFVVLSRPRSPTRFRAPPTPLSPPADKDIPANAKPISSVHQVSTAVRRNKTDVSAVAAALKTLQLQDTDPRTHSPKRKGRKRTAARPSPSPSPSPAPTPVADRPPSVDGPSARKPGRRRRQAAAKPSGPGTSGFGARPIVDDISEQPDSASERDDSEPGASLYDAAASYINAFLADKTSVCRLTLLQSLIIELGLASSALPASLTAAKAMLKSRAFLNVGEYLAARQQGPAAVQCVMHKSRASLIRDLRRKRNFTSLQWVKESGLQVLLVSC